MRNRGGVPNLEHHCGYPLWIGTNGIGIGLTGATALSEVRLYILEDNIAEKNSFATLLLSWSF